MGLFRRIFGRESEDPAERARDFMRSMERLLKEEGAKATMLFMSTSEYEQLAEQYLPTHLVGVGGPLHNEYVAVLAKIKTALDRELGLAR